MSYTEQINQTVLEFFEKASDVILSYRDFKIHQATISQHLQQISNSGNSKEQQQQNSIIQSESNKLQCQQQEDYKPHQEKQNRQDQQNEQQINQNQSNNNNKGGGNQQIQQKEDDKQLQQKQKQETILDDIQIISKDDLEILKLENFQIQKVFNYKIVEKLIEKDPLWMLPDNKEIFIEIYMTQIESDTDDKNKNQKQTGVCDLYEEEEEEKKINEQKINQIQQKQQNQQQQQSHKAKQIKVEQWHLKFSHKTPQTFQQQLSKNQKEDILNNIQSRNSDTIRDPYKFNQALTILLRSILSMLGTFPLNNLLQKRMSALKGQRNLIKQLREKIKNILHKKQENEKESETEEKGQIRQATLQEKEILIQNLREEEESYQQQKQQVKILKKIHIDHKSLNKFTSYGSCQSKNIVKKLSHTIQLLHHEFTLDVEYLADLSSMEVKEQQIQLQSGCVIQKIADIQQVRKESQQTEIEEEVQCIDIKKSESDCEQKQSPLKTEPTEYLDEDQQEQEEEGKSIDILEQQQRYREKQTPFQLAKMRKTSDSILPGHSDTPSQEKKKKPMTLRDLKMEKRQLDQQKNQKQNKKKFDGIREQNSDQEQDDATSQSSEIFLQKTISNSSQQNIIYNQNAEQIQQNQFHFSNSSGSGHSSSSPQKVQCSSDKKNNKNNNNSNDNNNNNNHKIECFFNHIAELQQKMKSISDPFPRKLGEVQKILNQQLQNQINSKKYESKRTN